MSQLWLYLHWCHFSHFFACSSDSRRIWSEPWVVSWLAPLIWSHWSMYRPDSTRNLAWDPGSNAANVAWNPTALQRFMTFIGAFCHPPGNLSSPGDCRPRDHWHCTYSWTFYSSLKSPYLHYCSISANSAFSLSINASPPIAALWGLKSSPTDRRRGWASSDWKRSFFVCCFNIDYYYDYGDHFS